MNTRTESASSKPAKKILVGLCSLQVRCVVVLRFNISAFLRVTLQLPPGFEYVPIRVPYYMEVHNALARAPESFFFDSTGLINRPHGLHVLSPYPLLAAACQPLSHPNRLRTPQSNAARTEVTELVELYSRHPAAGAFQAAVLAESGQVTGSFDIFKGQYYFMGALPAIEENAHNWAAGGGSEMLDADNGDSSPDTGSDRSEGSDDGLGYQLSVHVVAPGSRGSTEEHDAVATPAVLSSRAPWAPMKPRHDGRTSFRFASSSDFISTQARI